MSISYEYTVSGPLLHFVASGADDDVNDVLAYGAAVIEAALTHGTTRILCDERELEYRLGTMDTHRAATTVAEHAPHVALIALVCAPPFARDAAFFETVAVNRGLSVRAFTDIDAASRWLAEN